MPRLQMQEEQNVVSDQTSSRQYLDGEEVGTRQHRHMRLGGKCFIHGLLEAPSA
jgi:hypothetical protein